MAYNSCTNFFCVKSGGKLRLARFFVCYIIGPWLQNSNLHQNLKFGGETCTLYVHSIIIVHSNQMIIGYDIVMACVQVTTWRGMQHNKCVLPIQAIRVFPYITQLHGFLRSDV